MDQKGNGLKTRAPNKSSRRIGAYSCHVCGSKPPTQVYADEYGNPLQTCDEPICTEGYKYLGGEGYVRWFHSMLKYGKVQKSGLGSSMIRFGRSRYG